MDICLVCRCSLKLKETGQERYAARTCSLKLYTKCFFSQLIENVAAPLDQ